MDKNVHEKSKEPIYIASMNSRSLPYDPFRGGSTMTLWGLSGADPIWHIATCIEYRIDVLRIGSNGKFHDENKYVLHYTNIMCIIYYIVC